jgi:hypothetical protein
LALGMESKTVSAWEGAADCARTQRDIPRSGAAKAQSKHEERFRKVDFMAKGVYKDTFRSNDQNPMML